MAQRQPVTRETPEPMSDVTYDLSTTLSSLGKGAHALETYIEDAKKANDAGATNALGQVRDSLLCKADRVRRFIRDETSNGKF
jgi:hypothetical protein